jgi:flagella basal body P-ring formation protein FlgA
MPDAPSGAAVMLRVTAGALQIVAEGRLLQDASVGDEVRAYNQATDAVVRGVLVAPDTVEL